MCHFSWIHESSYGLSYPETTHVGKGFLGRVFSEEGILVDPHKVEAVVVWVQPTSVAEVRSPLGCAGDYLVLWKHISTTIAHLTQLMRNGMTFG